MLNVAIFEKYDIEDDVSGLIVSPVNMPTLGDGSVYDKHGEYVFTSFYFALQWTLGGKIKDSELDDLLKVHYLPRTAYALKYAVNNDVKLGNLSSTKLDYVSVDIDVKHEIALADSGCVMFAGAGNDGNEPVNHFEGAPASRESWLGVGAVDFNLDARGYSSWGNDEVYVCGMDGLFDEDDGSLALGTSYASPFVMGVVAGYMLLHEKYVGFLPSKAQTLAWIEKHVIDINIDGFDAKTGYGALLPPDKSEFIYTKYDTTTKYKSLNKVVNGKLTTSPTDKLIDLDIADINAITGFYDKENHVAYYSYVV